MARTDDAGVQGPCWEVSFQGDRMQNGTKPCQRQYIGSEPQWAPRVPEVSAQKKTRSAHSSEEQPMTRVHPITRRQALKITAGAVGASLPLVHVQTAGAAGKLTMGIWDHWVPAANPVLKGLVDEWAAKNKVEVTIDFIPSAGNKMILT